MVKRTGRHRNSWRRMRSSSIHLRGLILFSSWGGVGVGFFGFFLVPNVFSSSSQCVLIKFSMSSNSFSPPLPNKFPIAPHFIPYPLPKSFTLVD